MNQSKPVDVRPATFGSVSARIWPGAFPAGAVRCDAASETGPTFLCDILAEIDVIT